MPRFICFYGTRLVIVAAQNEHDARALVRDRLRERRVAHSWNDVRVRLLREADLAIVDQWESLNDVFQQGKKRPRRLLA